MMTTARTEPTTAPATVPLGVPGECEGVGVGVVMGFVVIGNEIARVDAIVSLLEDVEDMEEVEGSSQEPKPGWHNPGLQLLEIY